VAGSTWNIVVICKQAQSCGIPYCTLADAYGAFGACASVCVSVGATECGTPLSCFRPETQEGGLAAVAMMCAAVGGQGLS
jgi:hypothetical protein